MINAGLQASIFVVANTMPRLLTMSKADRLSSLAVAVTEGLGAVSQPESRPRGTEECQSMTLIDHLNGTL